MKSTIAGAILLLCGLAAAETARPDFFPHQVHVQEEELECVDCHARAAASTSAADNLNPAATFCADCHDPGTVAVDWPQAERQMLFSHQQHVETLALECAHCHPGVGAMEQLLPAAMPGAATCTACHDGLQAERDCQSCHTQDRAFLVPASHQPGWTKDHGGQALFAEASCAHCHAESDCQECHEAALLNNYDHLPYPRQTPFAPQIEGSAGLVLQQVHGLNFRFTHSIEAQGKSSECSTCHEQDTGGFCAECHNAADNPLGRPAWHGGPDWGALAGGVGTGGGRHAELARRDLENCASCHAVEGDDPSCLLCHMDRTVGRGNDPSTHASGFAGDIGEGDFHDDGGAMCFVCHTFKGPAGGTGFCGYCHGSKP